MMRNSLLGLMLMSVFWGCRIEDPAPNPFVYEPAPASFFLAFANEGQEPEEQITLINPAYPIELNINKDGNFQYYLENLGRGSGIWQSKQDYLFLYAERDLFVMKMYLRKAEGIATPVLEFSDRHGSNYLELTVK